MFRLSKYAALIGTSALLCSNANAIPGASVSYGANPVWSAAGYLSDLMTDATASPSIVVSGQDTIITDLVISGATGTSGTCFSSGVLTIDDSTGTLAMFGVNISTGSARSTKEAVFLAPLGAGIRIAEGESVSLSIDWTMFTNSAYCSSSQGAQIMYTLSGYYAEP